MKGVWHSHHFTTHQAGSRGFAVVQTDSSGAQIWVLFFCFRVQVNLVWCRFAEQQRLRPRRRPPPLQQRKVRPGSPITWAKDPWTHHEHSTVVSHRSVISLFIAFKHILKSSVLIKHTHQSIAGNETYYKIIYACYSWWTQSNAVTTKVTVQVWESGAISLVFQSSAKNPPDIRLRTKCSTITKFQSEILLAPTLSSLFPVWSCEPCLPEVK